MAARRTKRGAKKGSKKGARSEEPLRRPRPSSGGVKKGAKKSVKRPASPAPKRGAKKGAKKGAHAREPKRGAKKGAKKGAKHHAQRRESRAEREARLLREERNRKRRERGARRREEERKEAERQEALRIARNKRRRERERARREEEERLAREAEERKRRRRRRRERPQYPAAEEGMRSVDFEKPGWGKETQAMADTMRAVFAEMKSVLDVEGWESHTRVHPFDDDTIDGQFAVVIPPDRGDYDSIEAMVHWLMRVMLQYGRELKGCFLSTGWQMASIAQERRREGRKAYRVFEGGVRMGLRYAPFFVDGVYNTKDITNAFEGALAALQNPDTGAGILENHGIPPTGFYIRLAWSKDGKLRRNPAG